MSGERRPAATAGPDRGPDPEPLPAPRPGVGFRPVNEAEELLLAAVERQDADAVLKALLLAELVVPVADGASRDLVPGSADFRWRIYQSDGEPCVPVFTSATRCAEVLGETPTILAEGLVVVHAWPDPALTLTLNPGTPIGASLPGPQVVELARWAEQAGLIDILRQAQPPPEPPVREPVPLQKLLPHQHVGHYLQRGYDLVSGLVHPVADVAGVTELADLYAALALDPGAGFTATDPVVHLLRWRSPVHPDPGPPRPGEVRQVRLAGVRLPHGAELLRRDRSGAEQLVAVYDADQRGWRPPGEGEAS